MVRKKVFVAGHRGMVGSAIVRQLSLQREVTIVTRAHSELNLTNQAAVDMFFLEERPDEVYLAAAKVGGIIANNSYPADFIYQNLQIQNNVLSAASRADVTRLLFLGSSCIYPKFAVQPIVEEALLSGALEQTNEPYAIAKIAGIKLCESFNRQCDTDFRSIMPSNLYGPGDNYHPESSHVIPGLIRRFHTARLNRDPQVVVWGTGKVLREFLYVDDLAAACLKIMGIDKSSWRRFVDPRCSHLNVGSNTEIAISSLARLIANTVGYEGQIIFDDSKPDGTPRKLMDSSKMLALGWHAEVSLEEGLRRAYFDFQQRAITASDCRV